MPITNRYKRIPLDQIHVKRDARQRRELDVSDLIPSIKKRGVVTPIIVEETDDGYLLIAGERRFTASREAGLPDIPARLVSDLDAIERQILELEENVKRKDLDWKEEVKAVKLIHELYKAENPTQTHEETADAIGFNRGLLSMMIAVAVEVERGNKLVLAATGFRPAYNVISRNEQRRVDNTLNDLLEGPRPQVQAPQETANVQAGAEGGLNIKSAQVQEDSILNLNFLEWGNEYQGRPFNFIHCDFPYGINIDSSEQAKTPTWGGYADSDTTFWTLCACLSHNLDRLMTQSGHLMFWCPADIYRQREILDFFDRHAPSLTFVEIPLIWHKTDNRGILSDSNRRARHVYETALYASRGGRLIIKSVSDCYGAPTSKEVHQSEKPEPMLKHFFQMFVDEHTRLLDPTAGSGTALRAAEHLGAASVIGLEINEEYFTAAGQLLRKSRNLRRLSEAAHA